MVPRRWSKPIVYVIDLLAVVPSVVWGLWGIIVLVPWLQNTIYSSIASGVSGIPVLDNLFGAPTSGASFFTAGIILAIMITPIITSLSREVIATVPTTDKEGAYALGATRWEMIRGAVWPHSQGGVVGAVLVGLGRAMGETIAAALVIGSQAQVTSHLFAPGYSIPAAIANLFREAVGRVPLRADRARLAAVHPHDHRQPGRPRLRGALGAEDEGGGLMAAVSGQPGGAIDLRDASGWRRTKNQIATVVMWSAFVLTLIPLGFVLFTVISEGHHRDQLAVPDQGPDPAQRAAARRGRHGPRRSSARSRSPASPRSSRSRSAYSARSTSTSTAAGASSPGSSLLWPT